MIRRKLDCLNPNLQKVQAAARRKTPETDASPVAEWYASAATSRTQERCPVRALKEMSGAPKSR